MLTIQCFLLVNLLPPPQTLPYCQRALDWKERLPPHPRCFPALCPVSACHARTVANSGISSDSDYGGISSTVISAARHLSPRHHPQAAGLGPEAEGGRVYWGEGHLLPPRLCSPHFLQPFLPTGVQRMSTRWPLATPELPDNQARYGMHVLWVTHRCVEEGHSTPRFKSKNAPSLKCDIEQVILLHWRSVSLMGKTMPTLSRGEEINI